MPLKGLLDCQVAKATISWLHFWVVKDIGVFGQSGGLCQTMTSIVWSATVPDGMACLRLSDSAYCLGE